MKIDYSGYADLSAMYENLWEKFRTLDFTVYEKKYHKVVRPPLTDLFIDWECVRKIDSYTLFKINVTFQLYNIKEEEVVENGRRVKKIKGFLRVKFKSTLVSDWQNKWFRTGEDGKLIKDFKLYLGMAYNRFFYGRKNTPKPWLYAFGTYKNMLRKLVELTTLVVNSHREFFGMLPVSGVVEL